MAVYYVQKNGDHFGPLSRDELQQYVDAGELSLQDWAIEEGQTAWVPLGTYVQPAPIQVNPRPAAPVPEPGPELEGAPPARGMALAGLGVLLVVGGAFGVWQIVGNKPPAPPPPIEATLQLPDDMPVVSPPPRWQPLPTNNLPGPVPDVLSIVDAPAVAEGQALHARAESGDALSMIQLARRYEMGHGVRWEPTTAFRWAKAAADKDDARARVLLANYCTQGFGLAAPDIGRAAQLEQFESEDGALAKVRRLADAGDPTALVILGLRNNLQAGFPGNPELAYRQFRLAAEQGDLQAQHWAGLLEVKGVGAPRQVAQGARRVAAAAARGQALSVYLLGTLRLQQAGLVADPEEGVRLVRYAAEQGVLPARYQMGMIYLNGEHVEVNAGEACQWLLLAYEGAAGARSQLATLRQTLSEADYAAAVAAAAALDPAFVNPDLPAPDPNRPPIAPTIRKPVERAVALVRPALAPGTPEAAMQTLMDGLAQGQLTVVWDALPPGHQAEAVAVLKRAGQFLPAADHRRAFATLQKLAGLMRDHKAVLSGLAGLELQAQWDSVALVLAAISESELADPDWYENPDIVSLLQKMQVRLEGLKGFQHGPWSDVWFAPGEPGTVNRYRGNNPESTEISVQEVEGHWLPASWLERWKKAMAAADEWLGEPDAPNAERDALLRSLGVLEQGLQQLEAAGDPDQLEARAKGLVDALRPAPEAP